MRELRSLPKQKQMLEEYSDLNIKPFHVKGRLQPATLAQIPFLPLSRRDCSFRIYAILVDYVNHAVSKDALLLLTPEERLRFLSYSNNKSALNFLLGRLLIRWAISSIKSVSPSAVRISQDSANAKPYSAFASFNISHAEGLVVGVFGDGLEFGIDVEHTQRTCDLDHIVDICFPECLRKSYYERSPDQRVPLFFELWTYLEAMGKLTGDGLFALPRPNPRDVHYRLCFDTLPYVGHLVVRD